MTEKEFYNVYHKKVYTPDHPHTMAGGQVFEHRLEAEEDCGRYLLPTEIVHHHYLWDGSYYLAVCKDNTEHAEMHACEEAFRYCGHWDWSKCEYCKRYDDPKNLSITKYHVYHKSCKNRYYKQNR